MEKNELNGFVTGHKIIHRLTGEDRYGKPVDTNKSHSVAYDLKACRRRSEVPGLVFLFAFLSSYLAR